MTAATETTVAQAATRILATAGPTMTVPDATVVLFGLTGKNTGYQLVARGAFEEVGVRVLRHGRSVRVVTADARRVLGLLATTSGGDGR